MNGKVLISPQYEDLFGSTIFLAGPIQGAPNWQKDAINIIRKYDTEVNIASPRRETKFSKTDLTEYNKQVDWESHHLEFASKTGAIMFWLANEVESIPGRSYAQTTRFELGEWYTMHRLTGVKLVVGFDTEYSNTKYLKRKFSQKCPDVPLLNSLEETCKATVDLIKN